jgi:predicted flap endonuclease-1-like 5' DNA nuclease
LYENYSIDSKEKLQMMANAGDLTLLQGVGPKTAQKIEQSLNE